MNILFLVPYTPTLIRVRPYQLVRSLARRGNNVTLFTLTQSQAEQEALTALHDEGITVQAYPLTRARVVMNLLRALPTRAPLQSAFCWQPELAKAAAKALDECTYDIVHVEHLRGARYGLWLKQAASAARAPIIWDSVDCITNLFEQTAHSGANWRSRMMATLELGRTRRYEAFLSSQFQRILMTSEVDKARLGQVASSMGHRMVHQSEVSVVQNGVDLSYFASGDESRHTDTILFSGKMSYHANDSAALYLAQEIMPVVWTRRPDAKLIIAGSNPSTQVRRLAKDRRVQVTGYVHDLRALIRKAGIAAAPLTYGAGIQNKVLEAMACGTPVVATPQAVSALNAQPGSDCLIATSPNSFAQAIVQLMENEDLRSRISMAGRRYVERYHDWNNIAAQVEAIYAEEGRIGSE